MGVTSILFLKSGAIHIHTRGPTSFHFFTSCQKNWFFLTLQHGYWWLQQHPHLIKVSSHWAKFWSLGARRTIMWPSLRKGWMKDKFEAQLVMWWLICQSGHCPGKRIYFHAPVITIFPSVNFSNGPTAPYDILLLLL